VILNCADDMNRRLIEQLLIYEQYRYTDFNAQYKMYIYIQMFFKKVYNIVENTTNRQQIFTVTINIISC